MLLCLFPLLLPLRTGYFQTITHLICFPGPNLAEKRRIFCPALGLHQFPVFTTYLSWSRRTHQINLNTLGYVREPYSANIVPFPRLASRLTGSNKDSINRVLHEGFIAARLREDVNEGLANADSRRLFSPFFPFSPG